MDSLLHLTQHPPASDVQEASEDGPTITVYVGRGLHMTCITSVIVYNGHQTLVSDERHLAIIFHISKTTAAPSAPPPPLSWACTHSTTTCDFVFLAKYIFSKLLLPSVTLTGEGVLSRRATEGRKKKK